MNIHRLGLIASVLSFSVLAGCGSPSGESVDESSSPILLNPLPPNPAWQTGFTSYGIVAGKDSDGTLLYPCRATLNGVLTPGKTRHDWSWCSVSYGGQVYAQTSYTTLVPAWTPEQNGFVPSNAIPTGQEPTSQSPWGEPLYSCRANYGGSLQVGKTGAGILGCDIPFGGAEITVASYQILATPAPGFTFQRTQVAAGAPLPYNALQAGADTNGAPLFVCVAPYGGNLQPGKTQAGWGGCDISYGGREIWVAGAYQVLTPQFAAPDTNWFVAGTDTSGASLGICNAPYGSGIQVGKWISSKTYAAGTCDFPYGSSEITASGQFGLFEGNDPPR